MNSIYLWRIIYTFMIMIYHFDTHFFVRSIVCEGGVFGWYIAVDFFFMVSGFLLYQKAEKDGNTLNAFGYTLGRVKKIYPAYLLAFFITFGTIVYFTDWMHGFSKILESLMDNFLEAIMLQGIGLNRGGAYVNYTAWYISVLLIAGYFIYWLLTKKKELFIHIIAPIIIIVGYSYLYRLVGCLDVTTATDGGLIISPALVRGFSGMCLGVYAAIFSRKLQELAERKGNGAYVLLRVIGALLMLFVPIVSLRYGLKTYDFFYVFVMFFAVAICFIPARREWNSICKKIVVYFSNLTLNMYLIHNVFREWIFPGVFGGAEKLSDTEKILIMLLYIVAVIIASVLMEFVLKALKKLFVKKGETH